MIVVIGDWVLQMACAQLAVWAQNPHLAHLSIAVNVSARQFCELNFVQSVTEMVRQYDVAPGKLKIELTESQLTANVDEIIEKMNELKKIGITFSLDDFGTGYSSLAFLKRLPLDQVKIDKSFVMRYGAIILLNEIDLTSPEIAAGLNSVLDGSPLCIAENGGELIVPHPMM